MDETTAALPDTTRLLQDLQPSDPSRIDGYQVLRRIPGSHVSDVFVVSDGQLLVLKLSGATELNDPQRITREAEYLGRIKSTRVAKVVDSGVWQGRAYFVQEFIDGPTLADVLREQRVGEVDAYRVARGLAEALRDVHSAGMVHRDVKPSNIIISDTRGVVLVDFGIARTESDARITRSGAAVGTPRYMSPEQAAGTEVGPASDIYQWGLVVGEVLLGRHPVFEGDGLPSGDLGRLVQDAILQDPRQRPALGQVLAELDRTEAAPRSDETAIIPALEPRLREARSLSQARTILGPKWDGALLELSDRLTVFAAAFGVVVLSGLVLGFLTGVIVEGLVAK